MSETRRRIRAQNSPADAGVMGFVLDAPIRPGPTARFDSASDGAPLARALFAIDGVAHVEVSGATIWVRKADGADWTALKPAIAAAIRRVLDENDAPLGDADDGGGANDTALDTDAALLRAVGELLDTQVNPAVAAHGGHIAVERAENGTVYLRMTGGCQGCAASAATLRQGVERMLRAALPEIREIVDVTDHSAGDNPFYAADPGSSPVFNRPVPPGAIAWEDGQIMVDPEYLAPRLGLDPESLRAGLRKGTVVSHAESGADTDAGKTRITIRSAQRAWAAEVAADGSAREVPPPRGAAPTPALADKVRQHLETLAPHEVPITYGKLARGLGMYAPGSVRKVTRALEDTMREDAAAGRPFIAARVVNRGRPARPGKGFFDLARELGRGPADGLGEDDFHAQELRAAMADTA